MNRLHTKCFVGSTLLHVSLGLVLLVGTAFKASDKQDAEFIPPAVVFFPDVKVTDGISRGGNPNVVLPSAQQPPEAVQPQPTPPAPPPPVPQMTLKQPEPDTPAPQAKEEKTTAPSDFKAPELKKTARKPDLKPVSSPESPRKPDHPRIALRPLTSKELESRKKAAQSAAKTYSSVSADAQKWNEVLKTIGSAKGSISRNTGGSVSVDMPGVGGGGAAFINYAQFVKAVYDAAWFDPSEVTDTSATVRVQVVIDRDGSVNSARIVDRSGISALDVSVQKAIDRVRHVKEFPDGAVERQRTFIINFNLKAKRMNG